MINAELFWAWLVFYYHTETFDRKFSGEMGKTGVWEPHRTGDVIASAKYAGAYSMFLQGQFAGMDVPSLESRIARGVRYIAINELLCNAPDRFKRLFTDKEPWVLKESVCHHKSRQGDHEMYAGPGGVAYCRACGFTDIK